MQSLVESRAYVGRTQTRRLRSGLDDINIPHLDPLLPKSSVVSLRHISHILPTVYKPPTARGMTSISKGSIFFATGNKNKLREVCNLNFWHVAQLCLE